MKMKTIQNISIAVIIICLIVNGWCWKVRKVRKKYPPAHKLECSNGIIHHPAYGDYPAEVKYEPGMTLMPGQKANVTLIIKDALRQSKIP